MKTQPSPVSGALPIAPHQEEIWAFSLLHPASPAYNMPEVFQFEGDLDLGAVGAAFSAVMARHEALRTSFHRLKSGDVQVIHTQQRSYPVDVIDLRGTPEPGRSELVEAAIRTEIRRPFDLADGRLVRLTVVQVADRRSWLVLVAHHIACDGLSMSVVLHDFRAGYLALRRGEPWALDADWPGYSDFTQAALLALDDGSLDEAVAYWRGHLRGVSGAALPGVATLGSGGHATFTIPTELDLDVSGRLHALARAERSTPFAVLLTVMHVLLAAAGTNRTAFRTATSGRTAEFSRTVGMLSNTVVSRAEVDLDETFLDALHDVGFDLMDAIDHQDLPFSRLAAVVGDGADVDVGSIRTEFTAGVIGEIDLGEGSLTSEVRHVDEGPLDLAVNCHFDPPGVALDWAFACRSYSRFQATAYPDAYIQVLAAVLRSPRAAMRSLNLIHTVQPAVTDGRGGGPVETEAAGTARAEGVAR